MTPFTCKNDEGYVRSFSKLINGRPADGEKLAAFNN